jgi:hypothetical protein
MQALLHVQAIHDNNSICRRYQVFYCSLASDVLNAPLAVTKIPGTNDKENNLFHCGTKEKQWPPSWSGWTPEDYKLTFPTTGSTVHSGLLAVKIGHPEVKQVVFLKMQQVPGSHKSSNIAEFWLYHPETAENIMQCFTSSERGKAPDSSWGPAQWAAPTWSSPESAWQSHASTAWASSSWSGAQ